MRFADGVLAVKRLATRETGGWWVSRDNPREGRDSTTGGLVAPDDVLAVASARMWPWPRPLRRRAVRP